MREKVIMKMIKDTLPVPKRSIVLILLQFPLCLQLVGVCTEHWIEGRENWFVQDQHDHVQVTWIVIDSTQVEKIGNKFVIYWTFRG